MPVRAGLPQIVCICVRLGWLGIRLDAAANAQGCACISAPDSRIEAGVMPTDEEAVIAHHMQDVLSG